MTRRFRFGVNLLTGGSRKEWSAKCRHAEAVGYDTVLVPDHLGMPAPFPSAVAAAEATERVRVGTFVLNAGFWNPALLAREVVTTDRLTGGRFDLGLGTGYVRAEHEAAGLPWGGPGERVDHLERTIVDLTASLNEEDPAPRPPLLIGGGGDRMLRLMADCADIAAFTGGERAPGAPDGEMRLMAADGLAERVAFFRHHAGERAGAVELNVLVQQVVTTDDRRAAAGRLAPHAPHLDVDGLLALPTLLIGTVPQMAEQVREHRERYGFSYICVLEPALDAFAPVIEALRSSGE